MEMKKFKELSLLLVGLCFITGAVFLSLQEIQKLPDAPTPPPEVVVDTQNPESATSTGKDVMDAAYLRAAHYFSDVWPLNFWNSEMDHIHEDFQQIVDDGFNHVVLIVPWREFQPTVSPITYNAYAFEKLRTVIQVADTFDLDVILRIGYTWDFYEASESDITDRYYQLLVDENTKTAWYDYVETIYDEISQYENCGMAFITWEDFWVNTYIIPTDSPSHSADIGFQTYLSNKYTIDELNARYQTTWANFEEICIPANDQPLRKEFFAFYDAFLGELLRTSQEVFPDLSMEVRNDWDMYMDVDGEMRPYEHVATYPCQNSSYTTVMYGIPQGFENVGERVTAAEAAAKTKLILSDFQDKNGGKPVFVDQFIFKDNTPGFEHNAQLLDEEVLPYLEQVGPVLQEFSAGYGVWTYRNYTNNVVYNSQFALDLLGWDYAAASVAPRNDSNAVILGKDGYIYQNNPAIRDPFPMAVYHLNFEVISLEDSHSANLVVSIGGQEQTLHIDQTGTYTASFYDLAYYDLSISSDAPIALDNLDVYSHITEGHMYDHNNQELPDMQGIRALNHYLSQNDTPPVETHDAKTVGEPLDFTKGVSMKQQEAIQGLYAEAELGTAPWCGPDVKFSIDGSSASLTIHGYIPDYPAEGVVENTLHIYGDEILLDTLTLPEGEPFTWNHEFAGAKRNEPMAIHITADYSYVPAELGLGQDERDLAYLFQRIDAN